MPHPHENSPAAAEALARRVVERLQQANFTAYFAGGCVRDRLMNRTPKDFDVATSARPEQVAALFPRSQLVGAAFGVVLVKQNHAQVEVATFRADGAYSDGRHPDAVRFTTALEDAQRRDFTCNGLFLDPVTETLHDFVGGLQDIQAKILRAIGSPRERFAEDHLRMLRAVRFASRLAFSIHPDTRRAIEELQTNIAGISRERIGEEIRMMLEHPARPAAMQLLASLPTLFAEVFGFPPGNPHDFPTLANLPPQSRRHVALLALMRDVSVDPAPAIPLLRARLMLSNEETEGLTFLAAKLPLLEDWEDLPKSATKRLMAHREWPGLEALFRAQPDRADELLAFSERIASLLDEGVAPPPYITGDTLQKLGATPGPHFKRWLDSLYDRQLEGEFPTAAEARTAAAHLLAVHPKKV